MCERDSPDSNEFDVNASLEESSFSDSSLESAAVNKEPTGPIHLSYQVVQQSSIMGKDKLFNNVGYSYTLKRRAANSKLWRCSVRNKKLICPAAVKQVGENEFTPNSMEHQHPPKHGAKESAIIAIKSKTAAESKPFESATQLVRDVMKEELSNVSGYDGLISITNMAKNTNYHRRNKRAPEPKAKDFNLLEAHLSTDFLVEDLTVFEERHIIFATALQLDLLSSAKSWYVDGTFKIVKKTFHQLFTIHAFVKKNGEVLQFPLMFCFMTARKTADYIAVLNAVKKRFISEPKVCHVMLDFEKAAWKAFQQCFPQAALHGCSFHFAQAVYRKAQNLGLQQPYIQNPNIKKLIR